MVGGDATALARVRSLLDTFSAHVHHMGGSGAGHLALAEDLGVTTLVGPGTLTAFQVSVIGGTM